MKFYCGLAESDESIKLFEIILAVKVFGIIYEVQCAFESEKAELCDYLLQQRVLTFRNKVVTSFDFMALGYVISKASSDNLTLNFESCSFCLDEVIVHYLPWSQTTD